MEEQKINLDNIIVIEQLPKIRETLGVISSEIDKEIEVALSLDCTEENKKIVKQYRTNLNKIKTELEEKRKFVKNQVLKPYEEFENIYNELVKDKLTKADDTLKARIGKIESEQLEKKTNVALEFAKEWLKYYELEELIDVILVIPHITNTMSDKSIKEQIKETIERIVHDIKVIKVEEFGEELLVEYLENNFDYAKAKLRVFERHQKMNELKINDYQDNTDIVEPIVEEEIIEPPKEIVEEEPKELIECTFTVWVDNQAYLTKIRNFLKELGVKYE